MIASMIRCLEPGRNFRSLWIVGILGTDTYSYINQYASFHASSYVFRFKLTSWSSNRVELTLEIGLNTFTGHRWSNERNIWTDGCRFWREVENLKKCVGVTWNQISDELSILLSERFWLGKFALCWKSKTPSVKKTLKSNFRGNWSSFLDFFLVIFENVHIFSLRSEYQILLTSFICSINQTITSLNYSTIRSTRRSS